MGLAPTGKRRLCTAHANSRHHQVRASMQGKPKRVGRRSNWNKIGKHGHAYEPTPEPSTRGLVDIT